MVFAEENLTDNGIKIADYCYNNGVLIGTTMAKEVEIEIKNPLNYDLADKFFSLEIGVLTDVEEIDEETGETRIAKNYEYVPYGTYIVSKYEDLKSSNKYKIIAYDSMIKLNENFANNITFKPAFPIILKEFYREFMSSYGLEIEEQELPNENFVVNEMPNFDGYTGRSILGRIAELFGSFAKINRDNKCQMYLKTSTDVQIDLEVMNSKLEIDNQYGPVNVVSVGMSNVEGENVTLKDEESIAEYGEITIRIDDNPFIYTEELRELVIDDLYLQLHNFKYIPVKFNLKTLMYLDCGDEIQVRNMEDTEWINTIILNQNINIPRTRSSNIETSALTETQQNFQYISKSKQKETKAEIKVDKQNLTITQLAQETTDQGTRLAQVEHNVEGFKTEIRDETDGIQTKITQIEESINGIITDKTVTGGQNLVKNSVGYFGSDYWLIDDENEGNVIGNNSSDVKQNSLSGCALEIQAETIYQNIVEIKNGEYYLSFAYKRVNSNAISKLKVNDIEIELTESEWTIIEKVLEVNSNTIKIEITTDISSSTLITDLMLAEGNIKTSWTQNANESFTDTVQIGKGLKIKATGSDTEFSAEADGISIKNTETGENVAEFTKYGTETQELIAHKDVKVADALLIQKVGNQLWFCSI